MKNVLFKTVLVTMFCVVALGANAQIRYTNNGKITVGNTDPYEFYHYTLSGTGMYFKFGTSNFFQIDCTPAATRLASHYDQVVFYNTKKSQFNSIQVQNVYNYSDARAKTNIQTLNDGLSIISKLRPVKYDFIGKDEYLTKFSKNTKEIGLLAQELEAVLPDAVITDEEGKKLINYTALIPVLIDAVKKLQTEVNTLKNK